MRGPRTALIAAVVVTGVSATILKAQQMFGGSAPAAAPAGSSAGSGAGPAASDPSLATRSARQLLKNGLDYLNTYQDYDRALHYLSEASNRPVGLNDQELGQLRDALEQARSGQASPATAAARTSLSRGSVATRRPGALSLAPAPRRGTDPASDAIQQVSAEKAEPDEPPALDLPALPPPPPSNDAPAAAPMPVAPPADKPVAPPADSPAPPPAEPIFLTGSGPDETAPADPSAATPRPTPPPQPAATPSPRTAPAPAPAAEPAAPPADAPPLEEPPALPAATPAPAPLDPPTAPPAVPASAPAPASAPEEMPPLPAARPVDAPPPIVEAPAPVAEPTPAPVAEPTLTPAPAPAPAPAALPPAVEAPGSNPRPTSPRVASTPRPRSEDAPRRIPRDPREDANAAPAAEADELPPLPAPGARTAPTDAGAPAANAAPASDEESARPAVTLPASSLREVEEIAQRQEDALRRNPPPRTGLSTVPSTPTAGMIADTSNVSPLMLPRPPSPTEARPIRVIPVPEEFVPLPPRQWEPNRKYWAAAATCHMPLYFQDAVLERYGQGVEQAIGPAGRFFSYPLDDPRQSNQRNQLLQPMYSAGLFIGQIALLPYNLIMDPPWEAEYDLGYYRPGDKIPGDTYYLPPTGIGPPLRGRRY